MWTTRIKWGLLSFLTDPTLSELHRAYLEIVLREWVETNQPVKEELLGNIDCLDKKDGLRSLDRMSNMEEVSIGRPRLTLDVSLGCLVDLGRLRGRSTYDACKN
jgi:hypothetical protein